MLADERSIDALDFRAIRERLARETHSSLATARVLALEPGPVGRDAGALALLALREEDLDRVQAGLAERVAGLRSALLEP